jgi:hypothetical protein
MLVYFTDADEETIVAIDQCRGVLWTVVYDSVLDFWSAEHRSADGRQRRYICARSGDELAAKVEAAKL